MSGGPACGVCGAPVRPPYRAPVPEMAPDLDLRPGEPTRSTLANWIQTCRSCGAAAPDLAALPAAARPVVEGAAYRGLTGTGPDYALAFLQWAAISGALGDTPEAADATLQAAWAADDAGEAVDAARWRREAAALWGDPADETIALRIVDVLRRAGEFEAADARAIGLAARLPDETSQMILAFQRARIATRDIGRHLMSSALKPPAHRPHVSHGKETGSGLLSRLFKR